VPTIVLKLRVSSEPGIAWRGAYLAVQVRILAGQRTYSSAEQERLVDVFGEPPRWGQTLRSLLWTNVNAHVPPFQTESEFDLPIGCTYDFEVVSAKYFAALQEGQIPLQLLFSGTVFYLGEAGLQVIQIAWDTEAHFWMPVSVWKDVMRLYFPNSAWLRVDQDTFDRLNRYRMQRALPTWDTALDNLLDERPSWTR
jgi:hypothetical protein